ncbi:MAG: ABC transporter ATP-binding protein [Planctomycetes bacterium]|nr:ABC transporter ATP-binding protein [Planctomycetota bacterium]
MEDAPTPTTPPLPGVEEVRVRTVRRLLRSFLRHTPLFLATLVATALYSGMMTARVALIYPVVRIFVEEENAQTGEVVKEGERGTVETRLVRSLVKGDSEFSGPLARLNASLDLIERQVVDRLAWAIPDSVLSSPKRRAQVGTLATVTILFILITVLSALSNFGKLVFRAILVTRILTGLRVKLLRNLLNQPLAFYDDQKRGELISRMNSDVQASTHSLNLLTGELVEQPFLIVLPVMGLVAAKWWLGLIVAVFLASITLSLKKQTRKVHRRAKVRQRTTARVTEAMVQMFSGIRVVKAFGLEAQKVSHYRARNEDFARDAIATEVAKARTRTSMELLTNLAIVTALLVGGLVLGGGGSLPAGAMLLFLALMAQIYRPTKVLTNAYTDLLDNLAGADRTFEFMDRKPELVDKPGAIPLRDAVGTVRFEDVCFAYNGHGLVLDHINLEVPAGQVVALVGHSGAGKSTLVNLVPRFYDPQTGRITVDGTDIREFTRESLLRNIAVVTQEPFLFNASIRENIAYGRPHATNEEIEAAARAANIHEFIVGLPRGYDEPVGERGGKLSGGQLQRLTIARALLRDAKILILDEATSSLDTESERAVQLALQNLMRGRTTLVIAHRLSTVQHADKICVLQEGSIVEMGTHTQLMAMDSLYRRLYQLQFAPH